MCWCIAQNTPAWAAGKLEPFVHPYGKVMIEILPVSFFKKKSAKTILFPHCALTMLYQIICANPVYGGPGADIMWYCGVRKAGVTTAETVAGAVPPNLEVSLINLCFIKGRCKVKSVQLGWYPPQTINDTDTFGPSPLRKSKSDLKASGSSDTANFLLGGCLNASTFIHINSRPDTWAHCLELLMHKLEVCSPPPLPFYPA